jgi:hypothetical protein
MKNVRIRHLYRSLREQMASNDGQHNTLKHPAFEKGLVFGSALRWGVLDLYKTDKWDKKMKSFRILFGFMAVILLLIEGSGFTLAAEQKSADEVAKELSNPAGSLASLNFNLQYTEFTGDLSGSDDQNSTALPFDQPVFNAENGTFETADVNLGDITYDLAYAGKNMKTKQEVYVSDAEVRGDTRHLRPGLAGQVDGYTGRQKCVRNVVPMMDGKDRFQHTSVYLS